MAQDISDVIHHYHDKEFNAIENATIDRIKFEFLDYTMAVTLFKSGKLAIKIAEYYGVPLEVVEELSKDPDHGGHSTVSSFIETMVGLELEKSGILGITVGRGPAMADLKDGWERKWDVKAPPKIKGRIFDMDAAINSILRKFKEFPKGDIGILLCISFMDLDIYFSFQEKLKTVLSENELFRVRQVEITGLPECRVIQ